MNRTVLLVAVLIVLAGLGVYAYLNNTPSEPVSGAPLVAVSVPQLTAAQRRGEAAYDKFCAACHGQNAAGQEGVAPPLVHRIYEPGHHGDQAFYLAALNGARAHHWPFGDMPPVEGVTEADITAIIGYVRALQRANGID